MITGLIASKKVFGNRPPLLLGFVLDKIAFGRDRIGLDLNHFTGFIAGHVWGNLFKIIGVLMLGDQRIQRGRFQGSVFDNDGGSANDHTMIKLVQMADWTIWIQTNVNVSKRYIHLKTYPGVANQVVQFLAFGGAVKIDIIFQVYEIHGRDIGITVLSVGGQSADIG